MIHLKIKQLNFIIKSSNQHGVHSPFVYNLITKCFYKKTISNLWKDFFSVKEQIFKSKNNICSIRRISNKKAKLLIRFVAYFKPIRVLEIGTSIGLETSAIKIGHINSSIITLEDCPKRVKIAQELFKKNNFNGVHIVGGNLKETLPKVLKKQQFDFIYFNTRQKKETLYYFNSCLETINNDAVWVFNAIYSHQEIEEAWLEIKNHKKVTVTVDIFHWGIVFFRKEQAKEHFKIRV